MPFFFPNTIKIIFIKNLLTLNSENINFIYYNLNDAIY